MFSEVRSISQCGSIAALLALGVAAPSHAAAVYSYSGQQISGLRFDSTAGLSNLKAVGSFTSASASVNGSGVASNDPIDTASAYLGVTPIPLGNYFGKYALVNGGDFTRADAFISDPSGIFTSTGMTGIAVAESSRNTGTTAASSDWQILVTFTVTTAQSFNLSYNIYNQLSDSASGLGFAQSNESLSISIADQHGHVSVAPDLYGNRSLSAPPNVADLTVSGSVNVGVSLSTFTPGDTLQMSIHAHTNAAATVPEPAGAALVAVSVAACGRRRRRR